MGQFVPVPCGEGEEQSLGQMDVRTPEVAVPHRPASAAAASGGLAPWTPLRVRLGSRRPAAEFPDQSTLSTALTSQIQRPLTTRLR